MSYCDCCRNLGVMAIPPDPPVFNCLRARDGGELKRNMDFATRYKPCAIRPEWCPFEADEKVLSERIQELNDQGMLFTGMLPLEELNEAHNHQADEWHYAVKQFQEADWLEELLEFRRKQFENRERAKEGLMDTKKEGEK